MSVPSQFASAGGTGPGSSLSKPQSWATGTAIPWSGRPARPCPGVPAERGRDPSAAGVKGGGAAALCKAAK